MTLDEFNEIFQFFGPMALISRSDAVTLDKTAKALAWMKFKTQRRVGGFGVDAAIKLIYYLCQAELVSRRLDWEECAELQYWCNQMVLCFFGTYAFQG